MHFGQWLREQRHAMGINQSQFAAMVTEQGARTPQNTVSAWERGASSPTLRQYIALHRVLPGKLRQASDCLILPQPQQES